MTTQTDYYKAHINKYRNILYMVICVCITIMILCFATCFVKESQLRFEYRQFDRELQYKEKMLEKESTIKETGRYK